MTDHIRQFFELHRDEDVSGEGYVAEGVIFSDGHAAIHWLTRRPTTTAHPDGILSIKETHGHDGKTRIVLITSPEQRLARIAEAHRVYVGRGGVTSGDCGECGDSWPCPTFAWATTDRDVLATWDPADDCTGTSAGNPHLQPGQVIGYGLRGDPIVMPDRDHKHDPTAWRRPAKPTETAPEIP